MSYFGKYRGQVIDNVDPMMMARVQVSVPAIPGVELGWALPCSPYGGSGVGLVTVPPVGANVWVEFEGGNIDYPIWAGCFWGPGELPAEATVGPPDKIQVLKSEGFLLKASSAGPNEFVIDVSPPFVQTPLSMTFNEEGIVLRNSAGVSVHLAEDTLTLIKDSGGSVALAADSIEILMSESQIALTPEAIDIAHGGSEQTLDAGGVHITAAEVNVEATSAVDIVAPEVDVNDGALHVV